MHIYVYMLVEVAVIVALVWPSAESALWNAWNAGLHEITQEANKEVKGGEK